MQASATTEKLQLLSRQLMGVRMAKKRLEAREKAIKRQLAELWGSVELRSETRICGTIRLTARRQARTNYDYGEFSRYLGLLGKEWALELVTESKISKKEVDALIKQGELSAEVRELLRETTSYVVWVAEETTEGD